MIRLRATLARSALTRVSLARFTLATSHFDAVPVRRVSLWRASTSVRFSLARFHFGAFLFGAFPNCVSKLMHNMLFDHLFPFCACFLRRSVVYASFAAKHSTRLTFAYHFLRVFTLCVIYLLIISTRQRGYTVANLITSGVFLCLVHNCINHFRNIFIRADQGEVITSAGLKQFRVGEHSTPR